MINKQVPTADAFRAMLIAGVIFTSAVTLRLEPAVGAEAATTLAKVGVNRGVCAMLGIAKGEHRRLALDIVRNTEMLIYFQSSDPEEVADRRAIAEQIGLLGNRVFIDQGDYERVHLADNLADVVVVARSAEEGVADEELLRVLRPGGKAIFADREIVKPPAEGNDSWSHPYHGPDNNPQSTDQNALAPYLTQFLADPKFSPMPQQSVGAGGRIFRAFGHIAHKANQNAMLNTLICTSAYNGEILWKRPLKEGFVLHRNTMIATPEFLYMGDDESCKLIDAATGELAGEIVIPEGEADGPVWKWMALEDGVLYALVGGVEIPVSTKPSQTPGLGHWPWGMWEGHDYKDPKTNLGFGRNVVAIDVESKKILWNHREEEYLDSRGVCMKNGRIFCYSPAKYLLCLDAKNGSVFWENSGAGLLEAIGADWKAQLYVTGYSTSTFIKCNDRHLFFAGPQRTKMVAVSADDGEVVWQKPFGNYQLVLRDDALYAAGPQLGRDRNVPPPPGIKVALGTGEVLAKLPMRRACTRASGSVDSLFYRTPGGTVRYDLASDQAKHIAPMRPPCQDGVIISDGHLYWGPWMCGCQLSLYGHISLGPAGDFNFRPGADASRLETAPGDVTSVEPLPVDAADWPAYQADNGRSAVTQVAVPGKVERKWSCQLPADSFPTAPVAVGDLVFVGDRNGIVRGLDAADGKVRWQAYTAGPIYFPPAVEGGRLFVGSADGRVYAFEATTGRKLWSFRAAPVERWIPVYGKLISTWPVAGGVVVENGTVYAAAGIAHYDGTHVYALEAVTGEVKWYNDSSGTTSEKVENGVSLQGNLYLAGDELCFLGGGVHEIARYNKQTGKCLNEAVDQVQSKFHTSFYPYYPAYGKYVSLDHTLAGGKRLEYDAAYEGSRHGNLALLPPLGADEKKPYKPVSRWGNLRRRGQGPAAVWQASPGGRYNSFVVAPKTLLAAGHTGPDGAGTSFLSAIDLADGSETWRQELPGRVVKGGTAVSRDGRMIVSLENDRVVCFGGAE